VALRPERSHAPVALLVAVVGVTACSGGEPTDPVRYPPIAGRASAGCTPTAGASLRVEFGKHWALDRGSEVGDTGTFEVPFGYEAVTAFVDLNGNDRFDRFVEPSGVCALTADEWKCEIPRLRSTLHRMISAIAEEPSDSTYIFVEEYDEHCQPHAGASLCAQDRCTEVQASPFFSPSAQLVNFFSLCGADGFAPQDATVTSSQGVSTVRLVRPPDLDAAVTAEFISGALVARIEASNVDRLLIWAGQQDDRGMITRVLWTSEDSPVEVARRPDGFEARIPEEQARACVAPDCIIGVQMLSYDRSTPLDEHASPLRVTERRAVVEMPTP
jgi:hypothetical protein